MFSRLTALLALLALTVSASAQQPPASQSFPSYVLGKSLATIPLGSADYVPVIQGGVTRRVRGTDIGGGGSGITGTFGDSTHVPQCTFANGSASTCTNVLITGGSGTGANPTATASDIAVNGVALTFMRSDAAPAVQKGTNAAFGLTKGDGTTLTCVAGVCSSLTGGAGTVTNASNLTDHAPVIGNGGTVGIKTTAALTNGQVVCGATGADPTACTISGDGIMAAGGALTITKTSGVNFSALATTAPGTGVATALGVNVGSAGAFVVNGGVGGTPSSITLSNGVSLPATTGLSGNVPVGNGGTGTGTMTANALPKGNGSSAYTASALSDDGTKISIGEPFDLTSKAIEKEVANAGVTGTTLNKLAKLTSAPSTAVITAITDTDGAIGIVTGGAGTTSNARIALVGQVSCIFDGSTTAGDFVIISPSVAGDCRDGGSTRPTGAQTIGRVLSTNGAGGTYTVDLDLGFANTAGGGGIVVSGTTAGTANAQTMTASFSFLDGNVVVAKIGAALTNTATATLNVNSTGVKTVAAQDATGALSALVGGELAAGGTAILVAHTSCAAPISADCYTITTTPGSGAPVTASGTITAAQWDSFTPVVITSAAQTVTLPVATSLSTKGGLPITTTANSITLTPNAADGINGGTINTSVTIPANTFTLVSTTGASGVNALSVPIPSAGGSGVAAIPQGRLTLVTGVPVMVSDQTAKTTVYYDTFNGNLYPNWNGSAMANVTITADEISMGLDAGVPHIASGSLYDVFGTSGAAICAGPAWSSTSARGTGAGTTELQLKSGVWTNKNALTNCWGGASGTTNLGSIAANQGTYLGTLYGTAAGQTGVQFTAAAAAGGSNAFVGLFNAYNRVPIASRSQDNNASYDYTSVAWRTADNSSSNRVSYVDGLALVSPTATYQQNVKTTGPDCAFGINLNATTGAPPIFRDMQSGATTATTPLSTEAMFPPSLGLDFLQGMEFGGTTCSFENAAPSALIAHLSM